MSSLWEVALVTGSDLKPGHLSQLNLVHPFIVYVGSDPCRLEILGGVKQLTVVFDSTKPFGVDLQAPNCTDVSRFIALIL